MHQQTASRRIEFSDTDMGGVVHFSRFFVFMETAEEQVLRSFGATYTTTPAGRPAAWPKVAASCEYLNPLRYGDEVEILASVVKVTRSTVTYEFLFRRSGTEVARGRTTSVCCAPQADGSFLPTPIPAELADRLGATSR